MSGWPFDEVTTEHIGVAIVTLLSAIALWIKVHTESNGKDKS